MEDEPLPPILPFRRVELRSESLRPVETFQSSNPKECKEVSAVRRRIVVNLVTLVKIIALVFLTQ